MGARWANGRPRAALETFRRPRGRRPPPTGEVIGLSALPTRRESTSVDTPKVIIVGAGFAGLGCAHTLKQSGIPFVVLEAKDRVGGRVRTEYDLLNGHPVEAGAMMVHGSDASVLRWIEEFGLTTRKVPEFRGARFFLKGKLRTSLGVALSGLEPLRSSIQTLWRLPKAVARYEGPDITLDRFLEAHHALPTARKFVGAMYASINAADPEEVSVRGIAEEANAQSFGLPWANYQVLEGYAELAKRRSKDFRDAVHLRTRVRRIEWTAEGVRVQATGPSGPETFEGDAVVVTVSLGVLQSGTIEFIPEIPQRKREAIAALGFGHADKILLVFDAAVRRTVLGKATSAASTEGSWFFFPYHGRTDLPVVLEGFLSGKRALALSKRPEAEVIDSVVRELESMVPRTDLRSHLITARYVNWSADPDIRGGYTFPKVGGGIEQRRILAEPVDGVLFFAGESAHAAGEYATVHGALDSGVRAASEVRDALRARSLPRT